jgi:hypothetical protein
VSGIRASPPARLGRVDPAHRSRTRSRAADQVGCARVRIRPAAYSVARSMGSVALGSLRSEDVGKSTAPPVLPITSELGTSLAGPRRDGCSARRRLQNLAGKFKKVGASLDPGFVPARQFPPANRSLPRAGKCSMTPPRFTGARLRLGQSLETVALSGAELGVRIHSPPADSRFLSGFRLRYEEKPGFSAILAARAAAASAETRKARQHRAQEG